MRWQLLKFTNSKHLCLVAVAQRPEAVDGRGLPDLHVGARRVGGCWGNPSFPGAIVQEGPRPLSWQNKKCDQQISPICPARGGSVKVDAGIDALPLEDSLVLCRLALQPESVLVQDGRVVKLVVHVLDQAVELSP